MESSELKTIIEKSGLSAYRIEKDLKIPNGTLNQVIKGTKKLPEKYEEQLRSLGGLIPDVKFLDQRPINKEIGNFPEPEEVLDNSSAVTKDDLVEIRENMRKAVEREQTESNKEFAELYNGMISDDAPKKRKQVKRPDMSIADLL